MIQRARQAMRRQAHEAYRLCVTRGIKVPGFVSATDGYILACDYHDKATGKIYIATIYIRDDGRITRIKEHAASEPFNPKAHAFLIDQGAFIHTHVDADFDDGDAENGPGTHGHDAYDLYEGESHDIVIDRSGMIVHVGLINWDEVRFFEGMESQYTTEQGR